MSSTAKPQPYRVLARTYRPKTFDDVIGQDSVVTSLRQALTNQRIPHAILLTGIRGTGKTTLARLLARCLSCSQGTTPTDQPCGVCPDCCAIDQDRHMDILEFDAASRTSVDDIRDIIDAGQYGALSGRYRIYIIDEVHMLSKSAFNALLKTLEEPPPHLIFIFATTEIEKLPPTIVSRCMRCDLSRVDTPTLAAHLRVIVTREQGTIDNDSVQILARAADGSVRDSMSLLDQAFTRTGGVITAESVHAMLGLIDRKILVDMFASLVHGDLHTVLSHLRNVYQQGADMRRLLEDWLELVHHLTQLKLSNSNHEGPTYTQPLSALCLDLSQKLSISTLVRIWQTLHKGLEDLSLTPQPRLAVEMLLVELSHTTETQTSQAHPPAVEKRPHHSSASTAPVAEASTIPSLPPTAHAGSLQSPIASETATSSSAKTSQKALPQLTTFEDIIRLVKDQRELLLAMVLERDVVCQSCAPGDLALSLRPTAPKDILRRLGTFLEKATGQAWLIESATPADSSTSTQSNANTTTIAESELARANNARAAWEAQPLTQAVLDAFPGAKIISSSQ